MTAEMPGLRLSGQFRSDSIRNPLWKFYLIEVKDGPDYVINPKVAGGMFRRMPIA
jgi:hypothetical protein